jgi:6,7-dimethyl-8-ribityllumazine synthase
MTKLNGNTAGEHLNIAIVVSRFNEGISEALLNGALDCLKQFGVPSDAIDIAWVPGAFEIPLVAAQLAKTQRYDALITFGSVIRGETPHFDFVAGEAASGVARASQKHEVPILFGVLTTNTVEQAWERADPKKGNKGFEVALGAIEMANLLKQVQTLPRKLRTLRHTVEAQRAVAGLERKEKSLPPAFRTHLS